MRVIIRIPALLALLLAFLVPAGAATAAPATSEHFETFIFSVNDCNGEPGEVIEGKGTVHRVIKWQDDESFVIHLNIHAKGIGERGNEYVLNGKTTLSNDASSFRDRMLLVSKGSAPNQVVVITIDPNGNYVFEEDCKGRTAS